MDEKQPAWAKGSRAKGASTGKGPPQGGKGTKGGKGGDGPEWGALPPWKVQEMLPSLMAAMQLQGLLYGKGPGSKGGKGGGKPTASRKWKCNSCGEDANGWAHEKCKMCGTTWEYTGPQQEARTRLMGDGHNVGRQIGRAHV